MGNRTNTSRWSAQERLLFIERVSYWRGWVRRSDLCERFSISLPQASADLSEYMRQNPGALSYDLRAKRYAATASFRCKLTTPGLADAAWAVDSFGESGSDQIAHIELPQRAVDPAVMKQLVRAVINRQALSIYYYSINSGAEGWRDIAPRALANDGFRWHARAWCFEEASFKDFVLGRINQTRPSEIREVSVPKDAEWETWVTLKFRPHRSLNEAQRRGIEKDFGMARSIGTMKVRKAMLLYTESYLGLLPAHGSRRIVTRLERVT